MLSTLEGFLSDNRKIGIILTILGGVLLVMGVILVFDPVLLAMGNFLFIGGMPFIFGFLRFLRFINPFGGPGKWKGVTALFAGMTLVLMKWPIIGMIIEMYGIIRLFGSYFPMLLTMLRQVPIIGGCVDKIPFLKSFASSAAQQARKYPNV